MRLAILVITGLLLSASSGIAQGTGDNGHVFGSATCREKVVCTDDAQPSSSANYAMQANACITSSFGYISTDGFFDKYAGLNGSNCLTPIHGSIPKGVGNQLSPNCCIVKNPNTNTCNFHCTLITP